MSAVLSNALRALRISTPCATRPSQAIRALPLQRVSAPSKTSSTVRTATLIPGRRDFSTTTLRPGNWLEPSVKVAKARRRAQKGRPRVSTGGSTRGTTVVWGDYGLRMRDHHRRISAKQLKLAEDTIRARLRGQKYRLYKRVHCNISVSNHGNEVS